MICNKVLPVLLCFLVVVPQLKAQHSGPQIKTRIGARAAAGGFTNPSILVAITDDSAEPVTQPGPDGRIRPVLRVAPSSSLTSGARKVFETPFIKELLELERYAKASQINELTQQGMRGSDRYKELDCPLYLLLSQEEGGFARKGFWLQGQDGRRRYVAAHYVDLVVDQAGMDRGDFEEIFAHELGHVILGILLGSIPDGHSRNMHMSMTVTDYPTAFDEGYAEHFQPLVRDSTNNANLRGLDRGVDQTNLNSFWVSNVDRQLRNDGIRRGTFTQSQQVPAIAYAEDPDRYRLFIAGQTAPFQPGTIKNAQQMASSEGLVATLFYRLVNDEKIRNTFREGGFYRQFLNAKQVTGPRMLFTPYQNANLKVFAAIRSLGRTGLGPDRPLAFELIKAYGEAFPDEKEVAYEILINTTLGVTVSPDAPSTFEKLAAEGRIGSASFLEGLPASRKLLKDVLRQAMDQPAALYAQIGNPLWVLNSEFKIGQAIWDDKRTVALAINLNTATIPELMTIPGLDLKTAQQIVAARSKGPFSSIEDLGGLKGIPKSLATTLSIMREQMRLAEPYRRQ
jgi:hypothetical protein